MNEVFNAKSLAKRCEKEYIRSYFPNNDALSVEEYVNEYGLSVFDYNDIGNHEIWGMPFAVSRNAQGVLETAFQDSAHTLVVGTTQVGKTWGHVINSVYTLSAKKNKPSFMITDPKGEISENTAEVLRKRGYKIFTLNFKDSKHSHTWNPLLEIYDVWMKIADVKNDIQFHDGLKELSLYSMTGKPSEYDEDEGFFSFYGKAYADEADALKAADSVTGDIEAEVDDLVSQLVSAIGADAVQNSRDRCWQLGALEVLKGMIFLMLEDALDSRSGFTRENMNFMNMQHYYEIIREGVLKGINGNVPLLNLSKLSHKFSTDESIRHMRSFFENAPVTTRGYLGTFDNIMQGWFSPKIYALANNSNINLDECKNQPFVIYLVTRDYEKSDYFIAGLFIDWVYKQMLTTAENNGGRLDNEMFFLLDEFANIPVINGFANKIATSLSRRIIFSLYIQTYEQLSSSYGADDAGTIRANCNVEIFLGSQSLRTKREFADECGTRRIKTLDSVLNPEKITYFDTPVLSLNRLENLKQGEAYIKRLNRPVAKTTFEMAFRSRELDHNKLSFSELGVESKSYKDDVYVYSYLNSSRSMFDYARSKSFSDDDFPEDLW